MKILDSDRSSISSPICTSHTIKVPSTQTRQTPAFEKPHQLRSVRMHNQHVWFNLVALIMTGTAHYTHPDESKSGTGCSIFLWPLCTDDMLRIFLIRFRGIVHHAKLQKWTFARVGCKETSMAPLRMHCHGFAFFRNDSLCVDLDELSRRLIFCGWTIEWFDWNRMFYASRIDLM